VVECKPLGTGTPPRLGQRTVQATGRARRSPQSPPRPVLPTDLVPRNLPCRRSPSSSGIIHRYNPTRKTLNPNPKTRNPKTQCSLCLTVCS
jgi:hypothetical protein